MFHCISSVYVCDRVRYVVEQNVLMSCLVVEECAGGGWVWGWRLGRALHHEQVL